MGKVASVEDVVLQHEEDVEEHGEETETKLGGIAEDARPVVVVVRNQDHLQQELDNIPHHYHHHHHHHRHHHHRHHHPHLMIITTMTSY